MRSLRRRLRWAAVPALAAVLGSCSTGVDGTSSDGEVMVFAAASLTDAFEELADGFEQAHPGLDVTLNLAGSSSLREQILDGAPADVFAPADPAHLAVLQDAGAVVGDGRIFATNRLQIAVPAGNPAGVTGPADLGRDELLVGLCAERVPCGDLARQALDRAGVTPRPDTDEPDVRALLSKLRAGELDVGIVYRSDVAGAGGAVEGIDLPAGAEVTASYPIAVMSEATDPVTAEAFVEYVLSSRGMAVLARHGFDRA